MLSIRMSRKGSLWSDSLSIVNRMLWSANRKTTKLQIPEKINKTYRLHNGYRTNLRLEVIKPSSMKRFAKTGARGEPIETPSI